jgi:hypothetical protein
MGILALILGILGGLCAIMGIIIATEAVSLVGDALPGAFTETFWLILSGVLLLACIATAVSRREEL